MDSPRSRSRSPRPTRRPRSAEPLRPGRTDDRPRRHDGTSAVELTIFDATERLLTEYSLRELSVAQIIAEAGVSRATFYFYFSSKFSVAASLLGRVIGEIFDFVQPYVNRDPAVEPREALTLSLQSAIESWERHRPILRAAHEHWSTNDEIAQPWLAGVELFTDAVAAQIERDRAAGIALRGPDSSRVAAALIWGTQHALHVAGRGVDRNIPSERAALDALVEIWTRSIYGG